MLLSLKPQVHFAIANYSILLSLFFRSGKIDFLFKALCENEDVSKLDFEKTLRSYDLMIT